MDWLWQGLVSNFFWVVLTVIVGIIWGWLKHKNVSWLPVLAYGLAGCAFTAVIIYTMIGRSLLSVPQPQTTPDNVEADIRTWSDDAGLSVTKMPVVQGMYFELAVTLQNGNKIVVARANDKPNDIQIQTGPVLAPEHQAALAELTKEQADNVTSEITLELARSRMGYAITGIQAKERPEIQNIALLKAVPISGLTESGFAQYVNEMDSAISLVRATTVLAIRREGGLGGTRH